MFSILKTFLELDLEELEEHEVEILLGSIQRVKHYLISRRPIKTKETLGETLMAINTATDDEKFSQTFAATDADKVPVDVAAAGITVSVQDAAGADLSAWIEVQADPDNPAKFRYLRKPNTDGTQPAVLDFVAVAAATVGGKPVRFQDFFRFTPGVPSSLTAITSVEPVVTLSDPAAASSSDPAAETSSSDPAETSSSDPAAASSETSAGGTPDGSVVEAPPDESAESGSGTAADAAS